MSYDPYTLYEKRINVEFMQGAESHVFHNQSFDTLWKWMEKLTLPAQTQVNIITSHYLKSL